MTLNLARPVGDHILVVQVRHIEEQA